MSELWYEEIVKAEGRVLLGGTMWPQKPGHYQRLHIVASHLSPCEQCVSKALHRDLER